MSKMLRLTFLLACFLTLWTTSVTAQGSDAVLKVQNEPLSQVLRQLELKTDYRFPLHQRRPERLHLLRRSDAERHQLHDDTAVGW